MPVKSREESIPSLKPTPPAFGLRGGLAQPFDGEENVPSVMPCCGQSHPGDTVTTQRRLARSYSSPWANGCTHLTPLIRGASAVWVMGYVARNAVAAAWSDFPRETGDIARCPYPRQIAEAPNFFVSRYLTRAPHDQVGAVFREFVPFWLSRGADVSGPSNRSEEHTSELQSPC